MLLPLVLVAAALVTLGLICLPLLRGTEAVADRANLTAQCTGINCWRWSATWRAAC